MDHRWTRLLNTAGTLDAEILEEGLNSRNAVCRDHHMPEKCGYDAWKMMLLSHKPLDAVVLMLGTNDLKSTYHCSARYIANGLREYVREWMNPTLYEGNSRSCWSCPPFSWVTIWRTWKAKAAASTGIPWSSPDFCGKSCRLPLPRIRSLC